MKETVTKADLTNAIYRQIGLSWSESATIIGTILEEISSTMENGETVKISSFGTFTVKQKCQRIGRNPKTGVEAIISARRVLSFRPSHILRERINGR